MPTQIHANKATNTSYLLDLFASFVVSIIRYILYTILGHPIHYLLLFLLSFNISIDILIYIFTLKSYTKEKV